MKSLNQKIEERKERYESLLMKVTRISNITSPHEEPEVFSKEDLYLIINSLRTLLVDENQR